ncbi:hypothetical protein N7512_003079 [Penicillium capsulatum]|nr:hypothetical protein N7512_003079 [Penicillium capsulatum]
MGISNQDGIWNRVRSVFSHRYDGVVANQPDHTELSTIDTQKYPLKFSLSPNPSRSESSIGRNQVGQDEILLENGIDESADSTQPKCDWISGVYLCAKGSVVVLLLNLILIAVAAGLSNKYAGHGFASRSAFYRGSCTVTKRWNIALHLIVNGLSTCILAASNYCMQSLVAPTREEIDDSHARRRWLDIGGASIRNLGVIGPYRLILWLVLLLTATPFHLLYNSMIFQSQATTEYEMVIGPKDLSPDNIWNLTTPGLEQCFTKHLDLTSGIPLSPNMDVSTMLSQANSAPGKLDWHTFASSIANGQYKRLTASQCETFLNTQNPVGVKSVVALANDLSVSDGGNKAILMTSFSSGDPGIITGSGITDQRVEGDIFAEQSIVLSVPSHDGRLYYTSSNYTTQSSCVDDGASMTACSDVDTMLAQTVTDETLSLDGTKSYLEQNHIQDVNVEGYDTTCKSSTASSGSSHVVDSCLAIQADEQCQLLYSPPICIVIMLTGLVKVIAMILAARIGRFRPPPLLTLGDAVASFMTKPDPTTEGICWISGADVRSGKWKKQSHGQQNLAVEAESTQDEKTIIFRRLSPRKFWMQAASARRWIITIVVCLACITAGSYLLERAITTGPSSYMYDHRPGLTPSVLHSWWRDGLLSESYSQVDLKSTKLTTLGCIVVANTPQLAVTLSYYGFNSVLTSMLAAAEYNSYGTRPKPLRVTWPVKGSKQKSTYWLSVPYQYAIPVMVVYTVLHWLISQSIFYVLLIPFHSNGQPNDKLTVSELGYSPLPIFLAILVGGLMACILIGLSFRQFPSQMPLAGTCSIALSAACHPGKDENLDSAALGYLKWGETAAAPAWAADHFDGIEQKGHCSFSVLDVEQPSSERVYA